MMLKSKFKKEEKEPEMPYVRGVIVLTENAIDLGVDDDMNKEILIFHGEDLYTKYPYSESVMKSLQEIENIPIYDATKQDKFVEGEEVVPTEVHYESIQ